MTLRTPPMSTVDDKPLVVDMLVYSLSHDSRNPNQIVEYKVIHLDQGVKRFARLRSKEGVEILWTPETDSDRAIHWPIYASLATMEKQSYANEMGAAKSALVKAIGNEKWAKEQLRNARKSITAAKRRIKKLVAQRVARNRAKRYRRLGRRS